MNGLFHNCPILTSIDISSFETILSEVSLFGNEADNGKLIVQKDFYNKISDKPEGWDVIFVNKTN